MSLHSAQEGSLSRTARTLETGRGHFLGYLSTEEHARATGMTRAVTPFVTAIVPVCPKLCDP